MDDMEFVIFVVVCWSFFVGCYGGSYLVGKCLGFFDVCGVSCKFCFCYVYMVGFLFGMLIWMLIGYI